MKIINKDFGSYKLHLINTCKFKNITLKVIFHSPIKKEEITKRSLITDILLQASKNYDSRRKLTIESEELYSALIGSNNQRLGNYIFTSFNLQVLMDKYTEEGNLSKAIEFLSEIIFNPLVINNKFNTEKVELVKHNSMVKINSLKEDAYGYSLMRMAESFDSNSPFSYRVVGYLDDLESINETNLYETYNNMINNDFVDIFVVGDFDNKEMISIIKKYFKFKKIKKPKKTYALKVRKARKRRLFVNEKIDNSQSSLAIACPIYKISKYERDYPLILGNLIFGGGVDSKLFKDVREANSLCYTINSMVDRLDNMLVINAGIDKVNFQKVVSLVTLKLEEMKKGKFSEEDINNAKEVMINSLIEIEENENAMINEVIREEILEVDNIKDRLEIIRKIKKSDIVKAFKKIHMDTVFLLEGVYDEED